ncbi:amidase [Roseibium sp. SCP14]|uniref:amidase n=1 Tax=Roseibium sp. SCP14 TaxID=3141375 RepID=UPI0033374110
MDHPQTTGTTSSPDDFALMDATAQAELVRSGEASSLELMDAAIERIEMLNPRINAIASVNYDFARQRAQSIKGVEPFSGVPTLVKDLLPYPGHAAGFGSRLLDGAPALSSSDYAEAIDGSGLVVLGKSTVSEFGLLGTTETLAKGATSNPWDLSRSPGGSSGGAVAAVASGMVPIAHATDGGGSIRGPASFCGLFGFKPSRGRTQSNGIPPEMPTSALLADHCVSRSVRDSALWLSATEGPTVQDRLPGVKVLQGALPKYPRIGFYRKDSLGQSPTPEAEAALLEAAKLCESFGCDVIEIEAPSFDTEPTVNAFFDLTGLTLSGLFAQMRTMMGDAFSEDLLEPYTLTTAGRAIGLTAEDIARSQSALEKAAASVEKSLAQCDIILSPTVPFQAFPLGLYGPTADANILSAFTARLAGYTFVSSLAGWPAMSVPLHWTEDGLPIGCHFTAAHNQDSLLFSLAFRLEQAQPWMPRLNALTEKLHAATPEI